MEYLSDIIGEEYKQWEWGERIYISSQTGSGKTHFCLHILFDYAVRNNRRILYLVNRKALKEQIEFEINRHSADLQRKIPAHINARSYIDVRTYQSIESGDYPNSKYYYIVCDECHYFLSDANFNTNTCYSFNYLYQNYSYRSVFIFMSATIENFENFMDMNFYQYGKYHSENSIFQWPFIPNGMGSLGVKYVISGEKSFVRKYIGTKEYSYLKINFINSEDDVSKIIKNKKGEKWLIFYNNINNGKDLVKKLKEDNFDAIFLDADYESGEEEQIAYDKLEKEKLLKHDIIIATSVIDNGISIIDEELRNLIIFADTKEDLIQMLGRKRISNGEIINLYICKRSREYFRKRVQIYQRAVDSISRYEMNPSNLTSDILSDRKYHDDCEKFVTTGYKTNVLNLFSKAQILNVLALYYKILNEIEKDEWAFIKRQLYWLGFTEDKERKIIEENTTDEIDKLRSKIMATLDKEITNDNGLWDKNKNINVKNLIRTDVIRLIELITGKKVETSKNVYKNDRTYSVDAFNVDMKIIDLPFKLEKDGKDLYRISKIETQL